MEKDTVVAVYDNYQDAQKAVDALVAAGFSRETTSVNPESDRMADTGTATTTATDTHAGESGIGHFFRSLFGMDDEYKEHHDVYAESVRRGSYVVTSHADSDEQADRATEIMNRFNPVDIDERTSHWKQQGWSGYDASAPALRRDEIEADRRSYLQTGARDTNRTASTTGEQRIPVVEEQLAVGKRQVQRGGVRVIKRVTEKPVNESVQLREEHVNVERRPVDQRTGSVDADAFKEQTIELRENSEEAVVSKTARVVEEVVVNKEVRERTENINDTVRRTDVDVQQLGATDTARDTTRTGMTGDTTGTTGTLRHDTMGMDSTLRSDSMNVDSDSDFRRHWQTSYGSSGGRYEDYDDAYRYGSTLSSHDRYRGRQWNEYESDVRSDWERNHPGSAWDKVKDAVRYGAERVSGKRNH